tara:strand:+ start:2827 stop:3048 length:222 start_codon:yes stop_codon:yes gene_type:complete
MVLSVKERRKQENAKYYQSHKRDAKYQEKLNTYYKENKERILNQKKYYYYKKTNNLDTLKKKYPEIYKMFVIV